MIDKGFVDKIIQAMPNILPLRVVEIGPGLGDLTRCLTQRALVEAYEVDKDLYEYLKSSFKNEIEDGTLQLRFGDVLKYWDVDGLQSKPYWIVANIPYYITTPIIDRALGDTNCAGMILMVQKEVAKKLTAHVSTREYSHLTVLTQILGEAHILFDVPPNSFNPPPKVMSAVVKIVKKDVEREIFQALKAYLLKAFSNPRKTLLKNLLCHYEKDVLQTSFEKFGIAINLRPHELPHGVHFCLFKDLIV